MDATALAIMGSVLVVGMIRAFATTELMNTRKPIEERALANMVASVCECLMAVGLIAAVIMR